MQTEPPLAQVPGNRLDLLRLFVRHHAVALAVVKQDSKKLAGVVMRGDLLRHPTQTQTALLMNPNPNTMYAQAHVREAATLMVEARVPILPVVSGSNDVLGVVATLDLLQVLESHPGRVQTHLRRSVTPAYQSTPVRVAKEILDITGTPALPVLDDEGRLVGIVTDHDILQGASVRESGQPSEAGIGAQEDEADREGLRHLRRLALPTAELLLPDVPVSQIMVRDVVTVGPLTTVGEASRLMVARRIDQLPVVDERGRLLDMLTDLDLVRALC